MKYSSSKYKIYIIFPILIWIMIWLTFGWLDFQAVISILGNYLSTDGHITNPMVAFIKILFAPVYTVLPLIFIFWTFNNYWKKTSKKIFVYYLVYFIFSLSIYRYLSINDSALLREDGLLEYLTFAVSLIASILFVLCSFQGSRFSMFLGFAWFLFAMEEISWGQRIFNFDVPKFFVENNYQQEISLHNFFNPTLDLGYYIVNFVLIMLLTSFKNVIWIHKLHRSLNISQLVEISLKFGLWIFPCLLMPLIVFSPFMGFHEFIELQWAILGFLISFLSLHKLINLRNEIISSRRCKKR
jgi:hypothetical protein